MSTRKAKETKMADFSVQRVDDRTVTIDHLDGHRFRFGWARYNGAWTLESSFPEWNRKSMPLDPDACMDAARELAFKAIERPGA